MKWAGWPSLLCGHARKTARRRQQPSGQSPLKCLRTEMKAPDDPHPAQPLDGSWPKDSEKGVPKKGQRLARAITLSEGKTAPTMEKQASPHARAFDPNKPSQNLILSNSSENGPFREKNERACFLHH